MQDGWTSSTEWSTLYMGPSVLTTHKVWLRRKHGEKFIIFIFKQILAQSKKLFSVTKEELLSDLLQTKRKVDFSSRSGSWILFRISRSRGRKKIVTQLHFSLAFSLLSRNHLSQNLFFLIKRLMMFIAISDYLSLLSFLSLLPLRMILSEFSTRNLFASGI